MYVRTEEGRLFNLDNYTKDSQGWYYHNVTTEYCFCEGEITNQSNNVEELIRIGDLIEWYSSNSKRHEYLYIQNNDELFAAQYYPVTKVFAKIGLDFKLIASKDKGEWKTC